MAIAEYESDKERFCQSWVKSGSTATSAASRQQISVTILAHIVITLNSTVRIVLKKQQISGLVI